jgi:hypothetical protein
VKFGGSDKAQKQPLSATSFIDKYLAPAEGGGAEAHATMTSFGALPAKGEKSTPDGSAARPFIVVVEFGLTFTSTVPDTVPHFYATTDALVKEIVDARVYGGMHYRNSGLAGADLGRRVARWIYLNKFQPVAK